MTATTMNPKTTQCRPNAAEDRAPTVIAGASIDAISMPATFGALVQAELGIMMLAGPVLAEDDGSWTFLTRRTDTPHPNVPADLLPLGVRPLPVGTPIAAVGRLDRAPAIWSTVIGAARRVAHRTKVA